MPVRAHLPRALALLCLVAAAPAVAAGAEARPASARSDRARPPGKGSPTGGDKAVAEDARGRAEPDAAPVALPALVLEELPDEEGPAAATVAEVRSPRLARFLEQQIQVREQEVLQVRDDAIRILERVLAPRSSRPSGKRPPEGLFKLGELYWEESQRRYLDEMGAYQDGLASFREGKLREPPKEPRLDLSRSISLYEELLRDHGDFARTDAVRYLYGFALSEAGRDAEALSQFGHILKDHPTSAFAPDAHFAVAEHAFGNDDPTAALPHYEAVAAAKDSALADLALYKVAWCQFKLRRYPAAAETFAGVLARVRDRKPRPGEPLPTVEADSRRLEDEALSYLAVVFSEIGGGKEAADFLQRIGGEAYRDRVLARLARVFYRQARFERGIDTLKTLLELYPDTDGAPQLRHQVAIGWLRLAQERKAVAELVELARAHGPRSEWGQKRRGSPAATAAAELAEADLQAAAVHLHRKAQATKQRPDYEAAAELYREYLALFDQTAPRERIAQSRFGRAEALYQLERWVDAAEEWRQCAKTDPKGKLAPEAAYAAVQAYERASARERPAAGAGPKDPTPAELGLAGAAEDFVALFPADPRGPKVLFAAGKNLYDRGAWGEAAPRLARLAAAQPSSELTVPAADLALDAFAKSARWGELEEAALAMGQNPAVAQSPLGTKLTGIAAAARFSHAQELEKQGKKEDATAAFLGVAERYPKDSNTARALFNAGRLLGAGGEVEKAVAAYDRAAGTAPDADVGALAAFAAARLLEADLRFDDAARRYERTGKLSGADAVDARFNRAVLLEALGDTRGAAAAFRAYAEATPPPRDAPEALLRAGKALSAAGAHAEAEKLLAELAARKPLPAGWIRAEAHLARGLALAKLGKRRPADDALEEATGLARKDSDPRTTSAAARARFERAELDLPAYEAIRFTGGKSALKARAAEKAAQLKKLEAAYADVVGFKDPQWALAALCRIGELYEAFSRALYEAPLPKGLSGAEAEAYQAALREEAYPIEERGIEAFGMGLKKAAELRQVSPWVQRMRERLGALDPQGHPGLKELLPRPDPVDDLPSAPLVTEVPR